MSYTGSYSIPKVLAARPDLNDGQKLLLTVIASLGRPDKPCDSTQAQLGERVGRSRTTVSRWLQKLEARGYIIRLARRLPIPRERARTRYDLPVRIWRLFLRGWAMMGPKFRGMRKAVLDWIEQQLPLSFLMAKDDEGVGPIVHSSIQYKNNLTKRVVRGAQPAPDRGEQLSFAGLVSNDALRSVRDAFEQGLTFLSPERRGRVLAAAGGE